MAGCCEWTTRHVRGQRYGPPELGAVLFRPVVPPAPFLASLLCVMSPLLPLPLVPAVAAPELSVLPLPALPADPLALPFMPALPAASVAAPAPTPVPPEPPLPPPEPPPCAKDASIVPSVRPRARAVTTNVFFISLSKDFQCASQHALSAPFLFRAGISSFTDSLSLAGTDKAARSDGKKEQEKPQRL
jgi:hypothetical protein